MESGINRKISNWYALSCVDLLMLLTSGCAEDEAANVFEGPDTDTIGPEAGNISFRKYQIPVTGPTGY